VLAIVLALAAAIGYGASDFAGGLATRSGSVVPITLLVVVTGALIMAAALPFAASPAPSAAALAWGFGAGLSTTLGAFALYLGFRYAAFSVAGPLSAVAAAGFSVLAGLLLGERPADLALAGIALALPAIVAVSASAASAEDTVASAASAGDTPEQEAAIPGGRPAAGVVLGLVAGACFALLYIGLDRAGSDSGLWPVAAASAGELAAALAAALLTRSFRLAGTRPRLLAALAGAIGQVGTISFFFASHDGLLAVTAVLTSLYPAVTIVLARIVLGERLTALRLGGLGLAGACVALIAAGGAG
jgi:drug/metabolite transporter (DMT)-like permease